MYEIEISQSDADFISKHVLTGELQRCKYVDLNDCDDPLRLTVDHVVPKSQGGGNEDANIQLICMHHNTLKGVLSLSEFETKIGYSQVEAL